MTTKPKKIEKIDPYWLKIWKKLDGTNGLRKLYYGEDYQLQKKK